MICTYEKIIDLRLFSELSLLSDCGVRRVFCDKSPGSIRDPDVYVTSTRNDAHYAGAHYARFLAVIFFKITSIRRACDRYAPSSISPTSLIGDGCVNSFPIVVRCDCPKRERYYDLDRRLLLLTVLWISPFGSLWGAYTSASLPVFLRPWNQLRSVAITLSAFCSLYTTHKRVQTENTAYQSRSNACSASCSPPTQPWAQQPESARS